MGIITESTKNCLDELEAQRENLRISLAQIQLERRKFTKEEIVAWISRFKDGNVNDRDFQKEIIDIFVNSVFVYDDRLLLTYNFKDGTQTLTLQEIEAALSSDIKDSSPPEKTEHLLMLGFFFLSGEDGFESPSRKRSGGAFLGRGFTVRYFLRKLRRAWYRVAS